MTDVSADTSGGYRVGYARCSTDKQDLRAQKAELAKLGPDRVFTDEGFTGTKRDSRQGLDQALAAVRNGDTLVVTKLDRLARSVPDALAIADDLDRRGVRLQLGSTVYDPADPMGRMFFQILAVFAEFEANMIRMRTREGMAEARRAGKLRGRQTRFTREQDQAIRKMHASGDYSIQDIAKVFGVARTTIYRALRRTEPTDVKPSAVEAYAAPDATLDAEQIPGQTSSTDEIDTDTAQPPEPAATAEPAGGGARGGPRARRNPTSGGPRAVNPRERIDLDTVAFSRTSTGATRVEAVTTRGTRVLVGFLERDPLRRGWTASSPMMLRLATGCRTRQDALLRLVQSHAPPTRHRR